MPSLFHLLRPLILTLLATTALLMAGEATTTPIVFKPERHTAFLADIKAMNGDINVVFVGDSITENWSKAGKGIWKKTFAPMKALNLGIASDTTQGVLYRMQNGELDGYKAKVFVVMIGTNNAGKDAPEAVANGIKAIIKEIQTRQPQAKILLMGIFPRGEKPNPYRAKNEETNAIIAKLDDGKTVKYIDIGLKFLAEDRATMRKYITMDFIHPTPGGYQIWADAIKPTVTEILGAK